MFRNFISTLRHYKTASSLNIIGLSVALAAFIVISMQIQYELGFDKFHSKADRLYKVEFGHIDGGQTVVSRGFINLFGEISPMIEDYALLGPAWGKTYLAVDNNGSQVGFNEEIETVYPDIDKVFDFEMIQGSTDVLDEPTKVIIPRSKALLMFGTEQAVGKLLYLSKDYTWEVGGVYKDFPANTQLNNSIYRKISDNDGASNGEANWGQNNYFMYLTLVEGADPEQIIAKFNAEINLADKMGFEFSFKPVMTPISELYYAKRNYAIEHMIKHGDRATTNLMIAIAFLILLIAAINFVNFSTSLAPLRMKSINIQKVLGSPTGKLRWTLIAEAIGLCLLSYFIALIIVSILGETSFRDITISEISLTGNSTLVVQAGIIAILLGLFAGIYPAFYTTKFPPVMALKGGFAMSSSGRFLRIGLIGFQFIVSIALIVAALFMQLQNSYMKSMDTGLPKENIAIVELGGRLANNKNLDNELRKNPLIADVAYSQFNIGGDNLSQGWGRRLNDQQIMFDAHLVSWNFPKMMGLNMVDGNFFTESDDLKDTMIFIFNETAVKQYSMKMSDKIDGQYDITGIVKDFNFKSLHYPITPMALVLPYKDWRWFPFAYIKITGNPYQAVDAIRKVASEIDPVYPININFYDQTFDNLYQKEQRTTDLISLFSLLAVIISLVGVFGLVVFETQYRRKEIGLRKINGATITSVLAMFNRRFVWIVGVCFVISAPVAWYGVNEWLADFAYRTPLHWWVFAAALMIVLFITVLTVTIQSWRAATENPVKSLKSE